MRSKPVGLPGTAQPLPAPSILFVDDNPNILPLFEALFASTAYCLTVCDGPAAALSLAATASFDVLVTDFHMPEMNGLGLASALCAGNPNLGVVLFAATFDGLPTVYIAKRGWDLINKPIDPLTLVDAIDSQFRKSRIAPQKATAHNSSPPRKPFAVATNAVAPIPRIA